MNQPTDWEPPEDSEPTHVIHLTDQQLDVLADKVYERLKANLFTQIGKTVVEKILYLVGVASLMFFAWASGKGMFTK